MKAVDLSKDIPISTPLAPPDVQPSPQTVLMDAVRELSVKGSAKSQPEQQSFQRRVQCWLIAACILCLIVLTVSAYWLFFKVNMNNEVVSVLIPQPFTENNDFMYFHLHNDMKCLLVRPNVGLNNTYICKLISTHSWCRF